MSSMNRKEFLSLSALLTGAASLTRLPFAARLDAARPLQPAAPLPVKGGAVVADQIVVNGNVITMDPALPRAEAFAIREGRILAVGSNADIRNLASPKTVVLDAQRMTLLPGFIDAHCHPSGVDELYGVVVTPYKRKAEIVDAIRKKAQATPPGFWVEGQLFDDTKLTDSAPLDRRDLDMASTEHPIGVHHRGGHTSWYNSKALELAGITRETPDPSNGRFFRDASGDLTGRVAERAREVFDHAGKREAFTPEQARDRARAGMRYMSEQLTAAGLTTVHDAQAGAEQLRAYEDIYRNGELHHRVYAMVAASPDGPYHALRSAGVYSGLGDDWLRIGGAKFVADGSASERTMRMSTPYVGTNDYGILTMTQQEIHDAVEEAHRSGWRVGIHANGDVTIDMVLKAYERVQEMWPIPDCRHRIEHCTLVNPDLLQRVKAAGVVPTPFWTYVYFHGEKWAQYGEEKLRWMFAHRSFLDYGIRVPGASDYGPGPFEPLMAIQSMVTRRDHRGHEWGANQKVTVDQALTIATVNGAYASFEERTKGSITAGKVADFVILEKDPHAVDPNAIKDIRIARTVVGGTTMHPKMA